MGLLREKLSDFGVKQILYRVDIALYVHPKDSRRSHLRAITGAPNGNFREDICSKDDLRTRIFGTFVVKFLACLPLLGFSNIYKVV